MVIIQLNSGHFFCVGKCATFYSCVVVSSYSQAKAQRCAKFTHVLLPLLILTQSRKDAQRFLLMFCSLLVKVLRDTLRLCVIQNYILTFIDTPLSPFHIQRYNMREAGCHLLSFSIAKMYEKVCLTNRSTVC